MRPRDRLIHKILDRKARRLRQKFAHAAADPKETQWDLLRSMLRREARTGFGKDHGFQKIRSVEDFQRQVPIGEYDRMEPYIQRVVDGERTALFARDRVLMFALTSGTSAARKLIPVTRRSVNAHRKGWLLWGLSAYESRVELVFRQKVNFNGNDREFSTHRNVPCGSISGLTARMQSPMIRRTYVMPVESNTLQSSDAKYFLAWRIGLLGDVGSWLSPNPSTHLALARFGDQHKETLIRDIHNGTISYRFDLAAKTMRKIERQVKPRPDRARELEQIVERTGHLYPKDAWPTLGLIGCWLGGPLTAYLKFFPEFFGEIPRRDLGLIASEGRMTIPLEDNSTAGALDLFNTFFEFVPVEDIASDRPIALLPHELEEGKDYYIILTTLGGLYRYHIHDVVQCVGWFGRSPLIEFLNKGKHVTNLTGEKLSEYQVARSMDQVSDELGLRIASFALAPCFEKDVPFYGLFLERNEIPSMELAELLASRLDAQLRVANCEYDAKRASHRLDSVRIQLLPDSTWREFDRSRIGRIGSSMEQYKRPRLFADLDFEKQIRELAPASDRLATESSWR